MKPLGKIKQIDLRDVWAHEAHDFTKWLAEEENLSALGEEIGVELELIETESAVGTFNADIFAQEVGTGRRVVIENQLEDTNHDHLGKIITYAAGKGAELVVWVVKRARDEHRQAIEWLNQHTDSEFGFFLIEMELWSIDGSNPAPRFCIVERPNDWAKAVKLSEGMTELEKLRISYWQRYHEVAQDHEGFKSAMKPQKASKDHWSTVAIGSSEYHIAFLLYSNEDKIGIEIYVPNNKEIGGVIVQHKAEMEQVLGVGGTVIDASKASGIRFFKKGYNFKKNPEKWDEMIAWQLDAAVKLRAEVLKLDL